MQRLTGTAFAVFVLFGASSMASPIFLQFGDSEGQGFVLPGEDRCYALTAAHVVEGKGSGLSFTLDGMLTQVSVIATNKDLDVALLQYGEVWSRDNPKLCGRADSSSGPGNPRGLFPFGPRIPSRAGGLLPKRYRSVSDEDGRIVLRPMTPNDDVVQSDSGMMVVLRSPSNGPTPQSPSGLPYAILLGASGDDIVALDAHVAHRWALSVLAPLDPKKAVAGEAQDQLFQIAHGNQGAFTIRKKDQTPTYWYDLDEDWTHEIEATFDLGDRDVLVEGYAFETANPEGTRTGYMYLSQFRPGQGGDWEDVTCSVDRDEWSAFRRYGGTVVCRMASPKIVRGVRLEFNTSVSDVRNIRLLTSELD